MEEKNFITNWIEILNTECIKSFPHDFEISCNCTNYNLPGKGLLIGKQFFGKIELIDAEGSEVLKVENYDVAKFIIYANRNKPKVVSVPVSHSIVKEMNRNYEVYLDSIIKRINSDFAKKFPGNKNFISAMDQIFKHLNLIRL